MAPRTDSHLPHWAALTHLPLLFGLALDVQSPALDTYLRSASRGFALPVLPLVGLVLGLTIKQPFRLLIGVVASTLAWNGVAVELGVGADTASAGRFSVLLTVAFGVHALVGYLWPGPESLRHLRAK